MLKKIFGKLNIYGHCKELNVGLFSCPSFIFLIMGVVIIASVLATYYIAQRYAEPEIVIVIVTFLTGFLLVIAQVLVGAFERVVYSRMREAQQSKELIELKDQFVYIAVHDLSASATAIKWGLRTIEPRVEKFSDTEKEVYRSIRTRNERLIELVRQILLITRIESNKLTIRNGAISLKELLTQVIEDEIRSAKEKGVDIATSFPKEDRILQSDAEHLSEVLRILVSNAIYHAPANGGRVNIALTDSKNHSSLSVTNNGPEIDGSTRAHIFEKLWRDKTGKEIEGTGFGLFIVKQLTERLGGSISFHSFLEKTEFTLTFPKK